MLASHWWRFPRKDTYLAKRRFYQGRLAPLAFVEAAAMWLLGNLTFELIGRVDSSRVLRVRDEDLRDRPAAEMRRLGAALGIDLDDVVQRLESGQSFPTGHMLGGNDVRLESRSGSTRARRPSASACRGGFNGLAVAFCGP